MSKRMFFALWPGDAQRRALAHVQQDLLQHGGRGVHVLDIHLTLVFLGQIDAPQQACVTQAAGRVRERPFELVLDSAGCFPGSRVLWCGAGTCPQPLFQLVDALRNALSVCGFVPERRAYKPHATLVRKAKPMAARVLDPPVRWPVEDFMLAYGEGGQPPRYRIHRRWPLLS